MCQCKLTEFFAELAEFAAELSELSLPKKYSRTVFRLFLLIVTELPGNLVTITGNIFAEFFYLGPNDGATGVLYDGNDWRKYGVVPRAHPRVPLFLLFL